MNPTVNDFFCGAGGMGLGFQQAGFTIVGAWDFDKYAVKSYRENVGDHVLQRDISEMTASEVPHADVWTFGFPCQDLSVAGKQAGLFEGKRSGLFFEVMRLLDETPDYLKPKVLLAENVKGLKPYLPVLEQEYAKRGYHMHVKLFNSKYWGVPQSRGRYFVVGIRDKQFTFPEEQHEFIPRLSNILEENVDEKYYIADEKAAKIVEAALAKFSHPQSVCTDKDGCAYCCDANYFKGTSPGDVGKSRITHVIEPQIEVVGRLDIKVQKDQQARVYDPEGISPTLTAVSGGHHHVKILDHVCTETGLLNPNGCGKTLRVGGQGSFMSKKHNFDHLLEFTFRVRRLTPREYFRLQGFPDSYKFVCSDSQLYKQAGNAVTVNVAKAIAEKIKEVI